MVSRRKDFATLTEGKSYLMYKETIKSPETLKMYNYCLMLFLSDPVVNMNIDDFVEFAKSKPMECQGLIARYVLKQKERVVQREITGSTLRNHVKAVKHLLEMNDAIGVNWRKLSRLLPSAKRAGADRAPSLEVLRKVNSYGDVRSKFMLSAMISGGFRVGAWPDLKVGDFTPIERNGEVVAAKVVIYRGYPEEYYCFVSGEAWGRFQDYLNLRQQAGEQITGDSPALRNVFGLSRFGKPSNPREPIPLDTPGVREAMKRLWRAAGYRLNRDGKHDYKIVHSLRKAFKTKTEQVMKPINVETLLGHSTGVSDSYYKPSEKELLEDYLKAVPLLTISEAEEVRRGLESELKEEKELSRELAVRLNVLEETVKSLKKSLIQG